MDNIGKLVFSTSLVVSGSPSSLIYVHLGGERGRICGANSKSAVRTARKGRNLYPTADTSRQ